jgi:tellurite resistance protein TerC
MIELIANKQLFMILVFIAVILFLLIIDLGLFNKKDHVISIKESLCLSAFYVFMGLSFSLWIWYEMGSQSCIEYLTGYLIEKSLSFDNIFVFSIIFSSLAIPPKYQHRVLFFGILGVIILRALMILIGTQLVTNFSWILYVFSIFLIFMGIKMLSTKEIITDINNNKLLNFMHQHLRVTKEFHGNKFIVRKKTTQSDKKKLYITPLLLALIFIEFTDLIFAVDSVPAIFIITQDPYIVYTSNIFAILGLRALYFAISVFIGRFEYLKITLGIILIFIGSKIFVADFFHIEKIPPYISLIVTIGLLTLGALYSIYKSKHNS